MSPKPGVCRGEGGGEKRHPIVKLDAKLKKECEAGAMNASL